MKIKYGDLKRIVVEEMRKLNMLPEADKKDLPRSVDDAVKDAVHVEPGDEGKLEKPTDMVKALKIKEAKLLKQLASVRSELSKKSK